ncbi:MAG: hypothetical protein HY056_11430 [Proteobacteria bacterium]|nr:hypothetical protein [Pseudomonadota bacterium]
MHPRFALGLALAASACAGEFGAGSLLVAPGKYAYYKCPDIAVATASWTVREKEMADADQKAKRSAGGSAIGALVYGPEIATAREELRQLREATAAKNCATPTARPISVVPAARPPQR